MVDNGMNCLELVREATPATHRLIEGIPSRQWNASTPCEGMDVATLVQHLVGGLDQFAAIPTHAESEPAPNRGAVVPALEHHEAPAAYLASCDRITEAWSAPGVLERSYAMPWGETPGVMLMGFMVIEQVTHGWDLARATGQEPGFGEELAEATLALARSYDDETIRVPGMFGPVVETASDAPAIDRLAAFLGRRP